ncbi:UNVERIFIED_CONTAM: hypothetical protein RKD50_001204 [Streptomyces canus]
MAVDMDIVGTVAVDVVPIGPNFHDRLKAQVLPSADRIGEDVGRRMGEAISRHIVVSIPDAVTDGGRRARVSATREGGQVGGAFGNAVKRKLEEAFRSLPRANVRLGDTGIHADLDRLRARIQTLSGKTIGIDIDAGAALAEITAVDAALARLAAENPSVQIQTDTAAARAALAEVQRAINDVDRDDVNVRVDVDTAGAIANLRALGIALGAVAALPIIPVAAAGIGSIASAAVAAGAGVGALALAAVPAIKGVTTAITAKTAAEKEAASATTNTAAASVQAAQRALQMAAAQQTLTSAHRNAARSIAQANRQVEDAERALGQAAARAMQQREQAAENVERAERSLSDAKRQARRAEQDLTQARADAAQQLADLNDQLEKGKLDEREATLRLKEAEQELLAVRTSYDAGQATELEMERAQLSYDEAAQAAKQQQKDYKQLQKDADAAKTAGVDGNDAVKSAAERLADAQRNVADQTEAVADAHRAAAQAQVDAAQTVADAQRNMADAVANAATTQVQAAESIASAERGIESARLSGINTTTKARTKTDEYREALAKLTPEQRALFDSIAGPKGLTAAFKAWSKELQPDVLPLFTRGVDGAKNSLPTFTPLVQAAADAVGVLMDRASANLKSPFWQGFKADIEASAKPAIVGLGVAFGNVLTGMAGIIDAFLPHMDGISSTMQRITRRFANWGKGLKGSPEFSRFLQYSSEHGPLIASTLGSIAGAIMAIGSALSPVSEPLLRMIGGLATGVGWLAETAPELVLGIYGLFLATKLWALWQVAVNGAMAAFQVIASAGPWGWIALAIGAVVLAVIYAYNHFEWFRDGVQAVWSAIQIGATWLWEKALKPFFTWLGEVFVWLWTKIIKPHVDFIVGAFQILGEIVSWLWSGIFSPVFGFIGALVVWFYKNLIKPQLSLVGKALSDVGNAFMSLWTAYVKPALTWIGEKAEWLYEKGLKPQFDAIRKAVRLVADSFGNARDSIRTAWNQIGNITTKPVNFVIDAVYTDGIKALWDKVAKFVGMDPLPKAPKLIDPPKFARGGQIQGGTPGVDSVPILAMADEYVVRRDSARKLGLGTLNYLNKYGELPGVQRFKDGGVVSAITGAVGSAVDWTKGVLSDGAEFLANPSKIWDKLIAPILAKVAGGVGSSPVGRVVGKLPAKMASGLKDKILDVAAGFFSGGGDGGGGGNGQWARPVNAPFGTRFGVPGSMWSSGYHTGLDFPAPTGTPIHAVAAGQVVGAASGGPYGTHVIINHGGGLASLYAHMSRMAASVGEAVTRGQTIGAVGATGNVTGPHLHLEARRGGRAIDPLPFLYDSGGYLEPGLNLVANGTGKPEPVLTSQQWDDIRAARSSAPNVTVDAPTTVIIDGNEVRGIVDQRIAVRDADTGRAIEAGRYI